MVKKSNKKDEIQIRWSWKIFFIIVFLGLWLWTAYDYSNLEQESSELLNDYNSLIDDYNKLVEQRDTLIESCNSQLGDSFTCEGNERPYCLSENEVNQLENPCGEGNTLYCYRSDYNVGACLSNERVVCQS